MSVEVFSRVKERSNMKPTYDAIVEWMTDYFAAYNAYAQNNERFIAPGASQ